MATGDLAIAYTLTGTHQREYLGVEPTERQIPARGVPIARFKDSKIVARRGSSDALSILQQLGAMDGQDEGQQKELTNKVRQVHKLIHATVTYSKDGMSDV